MFHHANFETNALIDPLNHIGNYNLFLLFFSKGSITNLSNVICFCYYVTLPVQKFQNATPTNHIPNLPNFSWGFRILHRNGRTFWRLQNFAKFSFIRLFLRRNPMGEKNHKLLSFKSILRYSIIS